MNTHSLENCIATLQKVRDVYSCQLDTSVLIDLDNVIADLKSVHEHRLSREEVGKLTIRAMSLIAVVFHFVTNVKDWMK
jgi:hypothetical protein